MTAVSTGRAATPAGTDAGADAGAGQRLRWAVSDALVVTGRNVRVFTRVPQLLVFATVQPVLFVLMFRYVFGGAIRVPGVSYVDYLMPGIFAQAVAFGALTTGIGLAEDLGRGLIERFRSLPTARSAVLAGRTLADLLRNVFVVTLMVFVGFLVGFRVHTTPLALVAGVLLLLLGSRCHGSSRSWACGSPTPRARRPRRSRCRCRWSSPRAPSSR